MKHFKSSHIEYANCVICGLLEIVWMRVLVTNTGPLGPVCRSCWDQKVITLGYK